MTDDAANERIIRLVRGKLVDYDTDAKHLARQLYTWFQAQPEKDAWKAAILESFALDATRKMPIEGHYMADEKSWPHKPFHEDTFMIAILQMAKLNTRAAIQSAHMDKVFRLFLEHLTGDSA